MPDKAKLYIPHGCIGLFRAIQKCGSGTTTSGQAINVTVDFSQAKIKKRKKSKRGRA